MKTVGKKTAATGTVRACREIAENLFEILIRCPEIARAAAPGQFVSVLAWEGVTPFLRRPFSVARAAGGDITLIVKAVGPGSSALIARKKGETVGVIGPLGNGFPQIPEGERLILAAGGFGIAPLLHYATKNQHAAGVLLYGARAAADIPFSLEKLIPKKISARYSTIDGSRGEKGLITKILEPELRAGGTVLACGPPPMMKAAAALAKKHGVTCYVSMETVMACGFGACVGCAVPTGGRSAPKYSLACGDGPVFNAADIRWEEIE